MAASTEIVQIKRAIRPDGEPLLPWIEEVDRSSLEWTSGEVELDHLDVIVHGTDSAKNLPDFPITVLLALACSSSAAPYVGSSFRRVIPLSFSGSAEGWLGGMLKLCNDFIDVDASTYVGRHIVEPVFCSFPADQILRLKSPAPALAGSYFTTSDHWRRIRDAGLTGLIEVGRRATTR